MSAWETTATGHRCTRHGETFARGEICRACVDDPGPAAGETDDNVHDLELVRAESEAREIGKFCYRVGRKLAEEEEQLGVKLIAEGTKALRLACDLREQRAQRDHDRMLIRHHRAMSGLRKDN